jgi:hypothetical protein
MSGRTVFQFALTGLLAALFTNPGLAQYDPQEESPPEVLPMPREKTNTVGKAENPIVPASGIIPLPSCHHRRRSVHSTGRLCLFPWFPVHSRHARWVVALIRAWG